MGLFSWLWPASEPDLSRTDIALFIENVCRETPLKRCPFCGGAAEVNTNYDLRDVSYSVECRECWISTDPDREIMHVISQWNRRVKQQTN